MNRLSYGHFLTLISIVVLVPAGVNAQAGGSSVTLRGTVSETVALSTLPNFSSGNIEVVNSGSTVRLTLSGTDTESPVIRVPLVVRSNSAFKITAGVESTTALLTELSVVDVRATGTWVSPRAISELNVPQQLDRRGFDEKTSIPPLDLSRPLLVLSGPRVSLGGTLDSPNNALQITLLIRMKPQPTGSWLVHLTFSGTALNIF